jgi:hypothetical protein
MSADANPAVSFDRLRTGSARLLSIAPNGAPDDFSGKKSSASSARKLRIS